MVNPSVMRSAAWRSGLLGDLNNIDYASLSKLKASAESAKLYDAAVRKLALEGKMPPGWEPDYFGTYSTIDSGKVFNENPLPYTTVGDMIHPLVDNLKSEYINTRGGYDYFGVSENRAEAQVDENKSELLARQDVQRMIGRYQSMMGISKEAATDLFFDQARTAAREKAYENRTPNQYALLDAQYKYQIAKEAAKAKGKGGSEDNPHLTRRQLIDYDLANKTSKWVKENPELIAMQPSIVALNNRAKETGSQEDINALNNAYNEYIMSWQNSANKDRIDYMKSEFEKTAHFKPTEDPQNNKNYSRDGYLRGTKAAVKSISGTIGFNSADNKGDILLTSIGGVPQEYTTNRGNKQNVYEFASSAGFVLPEELFAQGTGSNRDTVKRRDWYTANDAFPFKQSLEEGRLQNVQFIPDNFENIVQMGNTKYVAGKLRIPVSDIENEFGTYIGSAMPFSTQSTRSSLKEYFGAKEITYGEDNKYYEIDIYRALPSDNSAEYWNRVNGIFENTPSHGGIGGAT